MNPGTLATQLLQKLQDAIGKEGVQAAWTEDQRPVATLSYYHRVLAENKRTAAGLLREAKTLSSVLDLLALDRPREAADVVAQRLVAMEFVTKEGGSWGVTKFVELVPQDGAALMDKSSRTMAKNEYKDDVSLTASALGGRAVVPPAAEAQAGAGKGKWEAVSWNKQPWGKGDKGKSDKGKTKGGTKAKADKGKGKKWW